jgi:hypothetical protein
MSATGDTFRYPSGRTRSELEEFHRQWDLAHAERPAEVRDRTRAPIWTLGRSDPTGEQIAAYATRMAAERTTGPCRICGQPLVPIDPPEDEDR